MTLTGIEVHASVAPRQYESFKFVHIYELDQGDNESDCKHRAIDLMNADLVKNGFADRIIKTSVKSVAGSIAESIVAQVKQAPQPQTQPKQEITARHISVSQPALAPQPTPAPARAPAPALNDRDGKIEKRTAFIDSLLPGLGIITPENEMGLLMWMDANNHMIENDGNLDIKLWRPIQKTDAEFPKSGYTKIFGDLVAQYQNVCL